VEILRKKITSKLFIFIGAALFIASLFFVLIFDLQENSFTSNIQNKEIYKHHHKLMNGDVVFRIGTGFWSPFFSKANKRNGFSHLGVIVIENEIPYILHAEADDLTLNGGIIKTRFDIFAAESLSFVVKKNNMPHESKELFILELKKMFNSNISFDSDFDLNDGGKKLYCTEFIWLAAKRAGFENFGKIELVLGKPFVLVDSIFESKLLGEIYLSNKSHSSVD
jgi:hypothetical protein